MAYIPIYVSFKRFEKYCVNVLQMDTLGIKEFWDDLFNDPEGRMDFFGDEWHIKVLLLEDPSPRSKGFMHARTPARRKHRMRQTSCRFG